MKIYKNLNVFIGKNFELRRNAAIAFEDGVIKKIIIDENVDGEDMNGGYAIPAFVNAHCHLGDTGAKELGVGLTLEEAVVYPNGLKHKYLRSITEEKLVETIHSGLIEMLRNGIAVAADYREGGLKGVVALKKAAEGLPIHALALGRPTLGNDSDEKEFISEISSIIEVADGFGMGRPEAVNAERMHLIRKLTKNKLFSIHIAEGYDDFIYSIKKYNKTEVERAIEFETDFMVHLTHVNDNDIDIMKKNNTKIVCCPRTNLIIGDGFPKINRFVSNKISWGIGTDNMMFTNPDIFREMDCGSRTIRGVEMKPDCMPFDECLKASSLYGAEALNMEDKYGSIEEGKSASFIVMDSQCMNLKYSHDIKSSIVHRCGPADISYFVLDGVQIIKNKEFLIK